MKFLTGFIVTAFVIVVFNAGCLSSRKTAYQPDKDLLQMIDRNFVAASNQYKVLAKNLPADKFPKTYFPTTGKYEFSNSGWWCSGFYPATLLCLYVAI